MIVLDKDHIEKAYAVIHSSADLHSLFLEHSHARCCLSSVEHFGLQTGKTLLVFIGGCGNTTHTLHDVKHGALRLKERTNGTFDLESNITAFHPCAIGNKDGHPEAGVKTLEDLSCYIDSGKNTVFFNYKLLATHGIGRNSAEGGVVAIANVFSECELQQIVDELIFCFHICVVRQILAIFVQIYSKIPNSFPTLEMKISLLTIGKTTDRSVGELIDRYSARISHYIDFEIVTIPDLRSTRGLTESQQKAKEGTALLGALKTSDRVVLLDERGQEFSSRAFATNIQKRMTAADKRLVFAVGGPYGFSEEVYARADAMMSLSKMTFPHELARLFFVEQVYRAMTILRGEPYHHD